MPNAQSSASAPTLDRYLSEPLTAGDPDVAGPLAVYPIFGPAPRQDYISFAEGHDAEVVIHELETAASVRDLVVENPTDRPVLLYEGEQVLGAQQNRTFDVTVLVPARSKLRVPVSCVEAGRWDGACHREAFAPSPQMAYPALRRMKLVHSRARLAASGEARADQGAVWSEIANKAMAMDVSSETQAAHQIFEGRRRELAALVAAIRHHDGQSGALVRSAAAS